MRHGKKFNHLSRQKGHRALMLSNMACSLIEHKRINTTVAKAKALKMYVEPLITKSKEDTTHNRRIVFGYLRSKYAVTDLFRDVAAKVGDRPGGYTRIIKVGNRLGDNADMAMIELVDFNELYNGGKKEEKKSRSRRGGKAKGATTAPAAPQAAPVAAAAVVADEPIVEQAVVETPAEAAIESTQIGNAQAQVPDAATEAQEIEQVQEALVAEVPEVEQTQEEAPVAEVEAPQAEESTDTPEASDDNEDKKDA